MAGGKKPAGDATEKGREVSSTTAQQQRRKRRPEAEDSSASAVAEGRATKMNDRFRSCTHSAVDNGALARPP